MAAESSESFGAAGAKGGVGSRGVSHRGIPKGVVPSSSRVSVRGLILLPLLCASAAADCGRLRSRLLSMSGRLVVLALEVRTRPTLLTVCVCVVGVSSSASALRVLSPALSGVGGAAPWWFSLFSLLTLLRARMMESLPISTVVGVTHALGRTGADAVCGICGVEANWTIFATEELAPVGVLATLRTRAIGVGALARLRLAGIRVTTGATGSEFGASRSASTTNGEFMRQRMDSPTLNFPTSRDAEALDVTRDTCSGACGERVSES